MKQTVKDLKKLIELWKVPENAEIWIEYPDQNLKEIEGSLKENRKLSETDEYDLIKAFSALFDKNKNRLYLLHNY